ncbi:hypothetical protein Q0M94_04220 [Deinococcus radiomollis]|uniref:hypothetical protein n=1 Tax=Deinococcus radiomollis TaxID=468916 RepID=UPI0038929215
MFQGLIEIARSTEQVPILHLAFRIAQRAGAQERKFSLWKTAAAQIRESQQSPLGGRQGKRVTQKRDDRRVLTHIEGVGSDDMSGFSHLHGSFITIFT